VKVRPEFIDDLFFVKRRYSHKQIRFRSASNRLSLVQRKQPPATRRTNILVMQFAFGVAEPKVKSQPIHHCLQVVDVHLRCVIAPASPAKSTKTLSARVLIKADSQG